MDIGIQGMPLDLADPVPKKCFYTFFQDILKVVTNEKGEAVGDVLTIIC
jgi:hypothetical protein